MKRQLILFLSSISFLMSYGQTSWPSEEGNEWMPYKGNENLVFVLIWEHSPFNFEISPTAVKVGIAIGIIVLIIVTDGAAAPLLAL